MLVNNSRTSYTATAGQIIYAIGFAYSSPNEIQVRTVDENGIYTYIYNWEFLGADQIRFTSTVPAQFEIFRDSDLSRTYGVSKYSVFNSGLVITANELNGNFELLRSAIEENQNLISDIIFKNGQGIHDTRYVLKGGDTMTGQLTLPGGGTGTQALQSNEVVALINDIPATDLSGYLQLAGGTMSGNLELGAGTALVFEGTTADDYETTLSVVDPTADRTVLIADVSGTIVTTGDTGSVTSTMITDGTIVDADINASAAISLSKLATGALPSGITVASANITDGTIVDADINASAAIAQTKLSLDITNSEVNASAAIAGTKISPDFGSQDILTTGSLGVGTTTPSSYDAGGDNLVVQNDGGTGAAGITIRAGTGAQSTIYFADGTGASDAIRGYVQYFHNGDFLRFGTDANERVRIDSDGNVGIGTTPEEILHVAAASETEGSRDGVLFESTSSLAADTGLPLVFTSNIGTVDNYGVASIAGRKENATSGQAGGYLQFATGDSGGAISEKARIDSSGNLIVGGTTTTSTNAAYINPNGVFVSTRTVGTQDLWNGKLNGTPTSTINADGSVVVDGSVTAQGTVLTSDQRFKENITDASPQLADVTALGNKLRNWDWTDDAPVVAKNTRFLGLVAQEVETICPGIVTTIERTKDGAELTPEVVIPAVYETRTVPAVLDEEGKVVEAETTKQVLVTGEQITPATYEQLDDSYKAIKNDILIMKLLGAVAELSAKVAQLETYHD